jgi:hypothetical protein
VHQGDDAEGKTHEWGKAITPTERPEPGDVIRGTSTWAERTPLVGPDDSTPLEEDEPEGTIPPCPLWAMKLRRHIQWHLLPSHERHQRLRERIADGDEAVYVIDDGAHHVMVGRRVGERPGEVEYCLIGRQPRQLFDGLRQRTVAPAAAFDGASEVKLCAVAVEEDILSSNIFDIDHYTAIEDVPAEYRPGAPYITFTADLDSNVD